MLEQMFFGAQQKVLIVSMTQGDVACVFRVSCKCADDIMKA